MKLSTPLAFTSSPDLVTPRQQKHPVRQWFAGLGQWVMQRMMSRDEPWVEQRRDHRGCTYWVVCDPMSNTRSRLNSEQEVRIWLEQRYSSLSRASSQSSTFPY